MKQLFDDLNHYITENKILESEVFLLSNGKWLLLLAIIFLGYLLQKLVQLVWPRMLQFTKKTQVLWDDILVEVSRPYVGRILAGIFWYAAIRANDFGDKLEAGLTIVVRLYISFNVILLIYHSVDVFINALRNSFRSKDSRIDEQVFLLLKKTLKTFVVIFGFLVTIQNFGINVVSLLAGLGLGGLAFALAAQDTCANFFGSLMILVDKPFRIGDLIKVDSLEGTVEDIGFRSTKVRTAYGSLITVPNAQMAKSNIDNLGIRSSRRVRFQLGLEYATPAESMRKFIEGTKAILRNHSTIKDKDITVAFDSYGDFSLNVLVNFFIDTRSPNEETQVKEEVLFKIYSLASDLQINFAFPTQTLHLSQS